MSFPRDVFCEVRMVLEPHVASHAENAVA
jgi:hypothetical protein